MKKTLFTLIGAWCCLAAMAQWSDDPTVNNQITPENYSFYDSGFAVSKDGTSYIVFNKPIADGDTYYTATFLQIVTKDGVKLFPDEGKVISHYRTLTFTMVNSLVYADNDGNALIFVSDLRHSDSNGLNYTVYKVSPTGELLWGNDGVDLERGSTSYPEANIKAVQLEDRSYVFAWSRSPGGNSLDVIVDRLSKDGAFLWDEPLVLPSSAWPKLSNAGNNQVLLTYAKGSSSAITVRKIDFDGTSVWPQGEVQVYRGGFTIPALEGVFNVTSDEKGGVFVSWYDDRNNTKRESAYVSHVKSNGQFGYTTNGSGDIKVGYGKEIYRQFVPRTVYDKTNDVLFVLWRETDANAGYVRIVLQKLSADGELLFDSNGQQVAEADHPESIGYYSLQNGKAGQVAVFYAYSYYPYQDVVNIAALYDNEGNYLWSNLPPNNALQTGILVAAYRPQKLALEGNKDSFISSRLVNEKFWVTLWTDYRFSSSISEGGTLFLQRVNIDGTLGPWTGESAIQLPSATSNDLTVNPSVIKGSTQFSFNNPNAGNVNISVYTLSGQKAAVVFNGKLSAGTQTIPWNAKAAQLSKGTYIVGITTSEGSKSVKVVII
jgi:hypothetical protein